MTDNEWLKLCRLVKNKGEYHMLITAIALHCQTNRKKYLIYDKNINKHKDLYYPKDFVKFQSYIVVRDWYEQEYNNQLTTLFKN